MAPPSEGAPSLCATPSPRTERPIFKDVAWGPAGPQRLSHTCRSGTGLLRPMVGWLMASTTDRSLTHLGLAVLSCEIPAQPRSGGQRSATGRLALVAQSYCTHSASPRDRQLGRASVTLDITDVTKGDWCVHPRDRRAGRRHTSQASCGKLEKKTKVQRQRGNSGL